MCRWILSFLIIGHFFIPMASYAYSVSVHERMSDNSYDQSILSPLNGNYLQNIGLDPSILINGKTARRWVHDGSRYEDDSFRALNHFYDPTTGNGLLNLPLYIAADAITWGLSSGNYGTLTQKWSIEDARNYYYDSLTNADSNIRNKNLAKTFEALGHVIHLIQDMAQPQHVRNDPHFETSSTWLSFFNFDRSRYERFTLNNVTTLNYSGYESVVFNNYRSFWENGDGKGLAEVTNRNFFSERYVIQCNGTNICSEPDYPQPTIDKTSGYDETKQVFIPSGETKTGVITFFPHSFIDPITSVAVIDPKVLSYSLFDLDLIELGNPPLFSQNLYTFEESQKILVPRAVGYSAGLINYFFRGQLEIHGGARDSQDESHKTVLLKVINNTEGEEATGKLTALMRYKPKDSDQEVEMVSQEIEVGTLSSTNGPDTPYYSFPFPEPIPDGARDKTFTVAFRGQLGAEEGAVIGQVYKAKDDYVFVIQDALRLNGDPTDTDLHCDGPCNANTFDFVVKREGTRRTWSSLNQVLTGRFETPSEITEVKLEHGFGTLYVNGVMMENDRWTQSLTPDPAQTWRVILNSNFSDQIILTVLLKGGFVFSQPLIHFEIDPISEGYKQLSQVQGDIVPAGGYQSAKSEAHANMTFIIGPLNTPYNNNLQETDMFDLIKLGGYPPGSPIPSDGLNPANEDYLLTNHLGINYFEYDREVTQFCYDYHYLDCGPEDDASIVYDSFSIPPLPDLAIDGKYARKYSDEELNLLLDMGVDPVQYSVIISQY